MKAVIIGSSGHYGYALPSITARGITVPGIAVTEGEDIGRLKSALAGRGIETAEYPADEIFDATAPDVAVINTIFSRSCDYACAALERGISVFLEKPAATEFAGLDRLISAWKRAKDEYPGIRLGGMFGIRYEAPFVTAERLVREGRIGRIILANGQKSYKMGTRPPFYSDRALYGGLIPWVSIHAIDWISHLTGSRVADVSALHSRAANRGNGTMESAAVMRFSLEDGAIATVTTDMLRPDNSPTHGDDRLRLMGDGGWLEVTGGKVFLNGNEVPLDPPRDIFADLLDGTDEEAETNRRLSARNLFESTRAALCARESADRDGEPVNVIYDSKG